MNVLTTEELQDILKLNPKQAKALMRTDGFPSVKIGREYRVAEEALMEWFKSTKAIKLNYSKC